LKKNLHRRGAENAEGRRENAIEQRDQEIKEKEKEKEKTINLNI
jgi:hypothetical protein